jgi:hypothetical protein
VTVRSTKFIEDLIVLIVRSEGVSLGFVLVIVIIESDLDLMVVFIIGVSGFF